MPVLKLTHTRASQQVDGASTIWANKLHALFGGDDRPCTAGSCKNFYLHTKSIAKSTQKKASIPNRSSRTWWISFWGDDSRFFPHTKKEVSTKAIHSRNRTRARAITREYSIREDTKCMSLHIKGRCGYAGALPFLAILSDSLELIEIYSIPSDSWHIQTTTENCTSNRKGLCAVLHGVGGDICIFEGKNQETPGTLGRIWVLRVPLQECEFICISEAIDHQIVSPSAGGEIKTAESYIAGNEILTLDIKILTGELSFPTCTGLHYRRAAATDEPTPSGIPIDPIPPSDNKLPTAAIAGGVVAGILVIIALISLSFVWRRRQKMRNQPKVDTHEGKPDETELGLVVAAFGDSTQLISIEERLEEARGTEARETGRVGEAEETVEMLKVREAGEVEQVEQVEGIKEVEEMEGVGGMEGVEEVVEEVVVEETKTEGEGSGPAERDNGGREVEGDSVGETAQGDSVGGVGERDNLLEMAQADEMSSIPFLGEKTTTEIDSEPEIQPVQD